MVIKDSEHFFYTNDGSTLKSMQEMLVWMKDCSLESFEGHINFDRNDFVPWVKSILKDSVLAKKMLKVYSKDETIALIEERLKTKTKKTSKKKTLIAQIKEAINNE